MSNSDRQVSGDPKLTGGEVAPALLASLEWRPIGPYRGGRVVAVAGDPVDQQVFYFGSTGGGVWKTTDGGQYWENVSDGFFKRASVGAIAVAPSDPNVIYVGMGETTIRGNVSHGDGVYRSTDGGQTWTHLGLEDTRQIGKIRIHPQNPDLVYVAALGHAHGPNSERGVFRSHDGGKTWEKVLFLNEDVGSHDIALDPHNPRILYAALWHARRLPHTLNSGGEGCGLYKSTNGGDSWIDISHNKGLPTGLLGKIGVAVSGAQKDRLWAIVEAEDGAVFRSDDAGATWERLSEEKELRKRPWYYQHIYADPQDANTLWILNEHCYRSIDGGQTFAQVSVPHGDYHDLWIDPRDSQRLICGHDGGACVSFNGAESWSSIYNQPTAEFYHVITDNQVPYRIYGAQQDNTTITVPSRSDLGAITIADYYEVGGGESGYIAVRSDDPAIVYAGSYQGYITRYDHRTKQTCDISVWPEASGGWPAQDLKYRFQWTFPIVLSPHDPNVLFATGNHVFRSTDEGASWEEISPDLTRNDKSRQGPSGGPITRDQVGTEYYDTIFAFAESPLQQGLFWAGSDDGLLHISLDGGQNWQNITPADLPEWALISIIEPSPHDPAGAYLAATRYKLDDFHPYLYKTNDYGKTWTMITSGIPDNDFTRVIREDPVRRGLLYAGTETGIYVSFDDGAHWQSLRLNLPAVPIHDLVIKDDDLIVATHGRSFWVLDDISPLRQMNNEVREADAHLFQPRPATRFLTASSYSLPATPGKNFTFLGPFQVTYRLKEIATGEKIKKYLDAGQNPPDGAIIHYYLKEQPQGEVTLTFLDASGQVIRTFSSEEKKEARPSSSDKDKGQEKKEEPKEPRVPKAAGANRFVWDLRYPHPTGIEGDRESEEIMKGPRVLPGVYQVQLKLGEQTFAQSFEVRKDPRIAASQEDFQQQFELLQAIRARISEVHEAVNMVRSIRRQADEWERSTTGLDIHESLVALGKTLKDKLAPIEEGFIQPKVKDQMDGLAEPIQLSAKLAILAGTVASADASPTRQARLLFNDLSARVATLTGQLRKVIDTDVAAFNNRVREASLSAIIPPVSSNWRE
jgi:photosystem II stability/assembly factor-like uncharacterized protein